MSQKLKTEITIDLAGNLATKAQKYGNSMAAFGKRSANAMAMMDQSVRAASKGFDSFGNRAIFGAGAIGFAFDRTFIKTAANFERLSASMVSIMGSESDASNALDWVKEFAQSTPYALDEVTQSFMKLKAFGLDPMDGTMQAIADQASKMGGNAEQVDGIATALGQAWVKGKLQAEEMNQMLERGVPVYEYLQKASKDLGHNFGDGFSISQLQDMAEQGRLTRDVIEDLIRVMGEESEGASARQMKTWNGMMSNIGDHWSLFQNDVMEGGAFDALKLSVNTLLDELDNAKSTGDYNEIVNSLGDGLASTFTSAHESIKEFNAALKESKETGEALFPILSGIKDATDVIADIAGGYGNLAKVLASIYAINKAVRFASPIMNGGKWVFDKVKGKNSSPIDRLSGASNALGATPVWVVNMPSNGVNNLIEPPVGWDDDSGKSKKNRWGKAIEGAGKAFIVGTLMEDLFGDTDVAKKMKATTLADVFPSVFDSKAPKKNLGETVNDYLKNQSASGLPSYLTGSYPAIGGSTGYPMSGDLKVKVDVSDDRVKTTVTASTPTIRIDPDMGAN